MKKKILVMFMMTMTMALTACSGQEAEKAESKIENEIEEKEEKKEEMQEAEEEADEAEEDKDDDNKVDAEDVPQTDLSTLKVGQQDVKFGKFMWRVLDIQDDKALLLTNDIVDFVSYNDACTAITWKDCDLREYLNGKFLEKNFSKEEQEKIQETTLQNPDNAWFGTKGCEDTVDKVFLLDIQDMLKYFGDSGQYKDGNPESEFFIDDEYNDARIALDEEGEPEWWFLRDPGAEDGRAMDVSDMGTIIMYGDCTNGGHGTRPACWVKMK